ncbi:hypothetical protein [Bacillus cereus]|uniref:hypothetical protein n=1 Tax=Bacillus cereus TaxID=1396 RepID=UPI0018F7C6C8|nr:hypothetical protein [Bacillus cereus]MBJ8024669.1 hypothetical protein [Bacillus cereus]MBJ8037063.1 hypothetical protein [Bacillus cereus]
MKLKKVIMGITATVCTFSAIAPLNAHASELKKGNTASGFGNINVENTSFDFNQTFLPKDKGVEYGPADPPGGGSDGYNTYVSSRTVQNSANERSLLIGLYSLAGGFWLGLGASIIGYLNGNQTWDYAVKTLYRHNNGSYKVSTLLYKNGNVVASGKSKTLSYKQLSTWYY